MRRQPPKEVDDIVFEEEPASGDMSAPEPGANAVPQVRPAKATLDKLTERTDLLVKRVKVSVFYYFTIALFRFVVA